mgnify:CR=1 FL=1
MCSEFIIIFDKYSIEYDIQLINEPISNNKKYDLIIIHNSININYNDNNRYLLISDEIIYKDSNININYIQSDYDERLILFSLLKIFN